MKGLGTFRGEQQAARGRDPRAQLGTHHTHPKLASSDFRSLLRNCDSPGHDGLRQQAQQLRSAERHHRELHEPREDERVERSPEAVRADLRYRAAACGGEKKRIVENDSGLECGLQVNDDTGRAAREERQRTLRQQDRRCEGGEGR